MDSTIPLLPQCEIQPSNHLLRVYSLFGSDLVRNPEDRFSYDVAHVLQGGAMNHFTAFPSMPVNKSFLCCTTHRVRQAGLTNWMSPQLCKLQDEKTKSPLFSGARSYK